MICNKQDPTDDGAVSITDDDVESGSEVESGVEIRSESNDAIVIIIALCVCLISFAVCCCLVIKRRKIKPDPYIKRSPRNLILTPRDETFKNGDVDLTDRALIKGHGASHEMEPNDFNIVRIEPVTGASELKCKEAMIHPMPIQEENSLELTPLGS